MVQRSGTRWGKTPLDVYADTHLTMTDKCIYGVVAAHANWPRGGLAEMAPRTVARILQRSLLVVERSLRRLVRSGWLQAVRQGWRVLTERPKMVEVDDQKWSKSESDTSYREQKNYEQTSPPPSAAAAETTPIRTSRPRVTVQEPPRPKGSPMTRRTTPPPDQPALLPTEREAERPTAQHLVAAWVDGYHEVRQDDPHPRLLRMVSGQAKTLAKDCTTIDHWRVAWRACLAAGRAGKASPAAFLADEQPRSMYPVRQSIGAQVRASLADRRAALLADKAVER